FLIFKRRFSLTVVQKTWREAVGGRKPVGILAGDRSQRVGLGLLPNAEMVQETAAHVRFRTIKARPLRLQVLKIRTFYSSERMRRDRRVPVEIQRTRCCWRGLGSRIVHGCRC